MVNDSLNKNMKVIKQKIHIKKLDEIAAIQQIDVIKIDVEGFEFEVLKGGKNKIRQNKPVIILEYSYDHMEKLKPGTSKELYDFIVHELNYEIKDLKTKEDIISFEQIEKIPQTDIVITPA